MNATKENNKILPIRLEDTEEVKLNLLERNKKYIKHSRSRCEISPNSDHYIAKKCLYLNENFKYYARITQIIFNNYILEEYVFEVLLMSFGHSYPPKGICELNLDKFVETDEARFFIIEMNLFNTPEEYDAHVCMEKLRYA